jgi:tetratricopeptide (TPR) repeat protein
MARSTRKTKPPTHDAPSAWVADKPKTVMVTVALVAAVVVGVLVIRAQVGPGQPVVDIDAVERQEDIRATTFEKVAQAEQLLTDNKPEQATRLLLEVTQADPGFYLGHLMLGYLYMQTGKLPLAAQATRRAYELEPTDSAVNYQMGQVELLLGQSESAIEHLAAAVRLRQEAGLPPAAEYHVSMADALIHNGQLGPADDQLASALEADHQGTLQAAQFVGPETQVALARALVKRQDTADAAPLFVQAAELAPDRADWQFLAARALFVQGRLPQAAALIQRAVDLDPTNADYVKLRRQIDSQRVDTPDDVEETGTDLDPNILDALKSPTSLDPFKE